MKTTVHRLSGKASVNIVIVLLLVAVGALAVEVLQLRRERNGFPQPGAQQTAAASPAVPAGPSKAAATPAAATAVADSPASNQAEPAKAADNPIAAMAAQMMNNPAMREMIAAQQKKGLETQYATFLEQQQFTPEQRTRFIATLIEGQSGAMDLGMNLGLKMISGDMTAADKDEMKRQAEEAEGAKTSKIEAFFSSEFPADGSKLEAFRQYEDLLPDREQVNMMQMDFSKAGHTLTPEQSTALAALMNEERKSSETNQAAGATPEGAGMDFAMNQESMDKALQEEEQMQKKVADRAASILGPEQMATLRAAQSSQLEQMKMGMQFSIQMMSSQVPAPTR